MIKLDKIKASKEVTLIKESHHYLSFYWVDSRETFIVRVIYEKEVHLSICHKDKKSHLEKLDEAIVNRLKLLCFCYTLKTKIVHGKGCTHLQTIPINDKKSNILFFK